MFGENRIHWKNITFHKLDWLEWVTMGLGIWFVIYPEPYEILFAVLMVIPILGLVLNGLRGRPSIASLVAITQDDGKDKYDVADFIDFAAIAILIRVLKDFEFESFYSLILPGTIGFVITLLILFATHRFTVNTNRNKLWIYGSLLFNVFLYSYAGTYGVNCVFDRSEPKVYDVRVIDKRISKGRRHSSYYLKITPWGHHHDPEHVSVSRSQYDEIAIGETVELDLKEGVFNIPWYYIERKSY
jgi:hypothetical protein